MLVLKMSEDKALTITRSGNTYEDENNAEIIKILLPRTVNDNDLAECVVHLCVINQDNVGDEINISSTLLEHDEKFYISNVDVTNKITYKNGQVKFWIKIINTDKEMIAKTNAVSHKIQEHFDIEDYIPEQQLSLLDDFTVRFEESLVMVEELSDDVEHVKEDIGNLYPPVCSFVNIVGGYNNWIAEDVTDIFGNIIGKRYGQAVNVNNAIITPNSKVDLQITSEQMVIFHEKDLAFVAENDGGVVTIYCIGSVPQSNYQIQAVVTEVIVDA